jgi:uncharacterized DUF497 family protein
MHFSADPFKRRANVAKHGIDFYDAEVMFDDFVYERVDDRHAEDRWIGIGLVRGVVYQAAYVRPTENDIHWISCRRATTHEQNVFWKARALSVETRDRGE